MTATRICDRSSCPAHALHRVDLYGQDFHFCGHHWAELVPVLQERAARQPAAHPARRASDDAELTVAGSGAHG